NDLPAIYQLFEEAIAYQQKNNYIGWKSFDKSFLQIDVENGFLLKIVNEEQIAGIFSICFSDPLIWREMEQGDALYLHRIVANRNIRGVPLFDLVLSWAKNFVKENRLRSIRMDTWAENRKIITYYKSYGFLEVEEYTTPDTADLPLQHRNLHVALLELGI
ncbi:MAG: N-acetyltransferase, partial [Sediminibacterium sp.]|nr:N-acetyltransferase [Sediminibacterium sp.]